MAGPFVQYPTVEPTGDPQYPLRIAHAEGDGILLTLDQAEVVLRQLRLVLPGLRAEAKDTPASR